MSGNQPEWVREAQAILSKAEQSEPLAYVDLNDGTRVQVYRVSTPRTFMDEARHRAARLSAWTRTEAG